MTGLLRTHLPTSSKSELAASAFARQGEYGSVTALAERYGVSRPTVYTAAAEAHEALDSHYLGVEQQGKGTLVAIDDAQITRSIVALRVEGQNSIRAIEALLPKLYSGVRKSYGTIQEILVGAPRSVRRRSTDNRASLRSARWRSTRCSARGTRCSPESASTPGTSSVYRSRISAAQQSGQRFSDRPRSRG